MAKYYVIDGLNLELGTQSHSLCPQKKTVNKWNIGILIRELLT